MIGDRIKELRKLKNLTQRQLANYLDLKSQTTIAAIESNKNNPSNELLSKIADFFNVSTDFLLGKTDNDGGYLILLIATKLNEQILKYNLTTKELAEKIGISEEAVTTMLNAKLSEYVITEYSNVAKYLGLSHADIMCLMSYSYFTFEETSPNQNKSNIDLIDTSPITNNDIVNIPIVGVVRAGTPILATENIEGYFPAPKGTLNSDKEYFYLKVKGDSMNLKFQENSLLLIEKCNFVENGEIGVVLINGQDATVKKIVQNNNMITLIPMSNNQIYNPMMYDMKKDEIKIIGKATMAINFL